MRQEMSPGLDHYEMLIIISITQNIAAFTPTLYNGTTATLVIKPVQKACVNTFYLSTVLTIEPIREVLYLETLHIISV